MWISLYDSILSDITQQRWEIQNHLSEIGVGAVLLRRPFKNLAYVDSGQLGVRAQDSRIFLGAPKGILGHPYRRDLVFFWTYRNR